MTSFDFILSIFFRVIFACVYNAHVNRKIFSNMTEDSLNWHNVV